jgi:hypothetical protein
VHDLEPETETRKTENPEHFRILQVKGMNQNFLGAFGGVQAMAI